MGWWLMRRCVAKEPGRCCWRRRRSGLAEDGARACRCGRMSCGKGRTGFICGTGTSITRRRRHSGKGCEGSAPAVVPASLNLKRGIVLGGDVEVLRGAYGAPLRMTSFYRLLVVDRRAGGEKKKELAYKTSAACKN